MNLQELEAIARKALDLIPPNDAARTAYVALARDWPEFADNLLKLSLDDPFAYDVTCDLAGSYLYHNDVMPDNLRKFAGQVLQGICKRPSGGKGASKLKNLWRNTMIRAAVNMVIEHGDIYATRNSSTDSISGCDVVAGLIHKSYDTVKEIYETPSLGK